MQVPSFNSRYQEVSIYFNRIAGKYSKRIEGPDAWFGFPYQQRLDRACQLLPRGDRAILDIGCGSGQALKHIRKVGISGEYFGCDLSERLLEESDIPKPYRFCGDIFSSPFHQQKCDGILMLGVSAYLTHNDLVRHLEYIASHISPRGVAIISFTNAHSWLVKMRHWARRLIPQQWLEGKTMGLSFQTSAYTFEEIQNRVPLETEIQFLSYLYPKGVPTLIGKTFAPEWLMIITNSRHG